MQKRGSPVWITGQKRALCGHRTVTRALWSSKWSPGSKQATLFRTLENMWGRLAYQQIFAGDSSLNWSPVRNAAAYFESPGVAPQVLGFRPIQGGSHPGSSQDLRQREFCKPPPPNQQPPRNFLPGESLHCGCCRELCVGNEVQLKCLHLSRGEIPFSRQPHFHHDSLCP